MVHYLSGEPQPGGGVEGSVSPYGTGVIRRSVITIGAAASWASVIIIGPAAAPAGSDSFFLPSTNPSPGWSEWYSILVCAPKDANGGYYLPHFHCYALQGVADVLEVLDNAGTTKVAWGFERILTHRRRRTPYVDIPPGVSFGVPRWARVLVRWTWWRITRTSSGWRLNAGMNLRGWFREVSTRRRDKDCKCCTWLLVYAVPRTASKCTKNKHHHARVGYVARIAHTSRASRRRPEFPRGDSLLCPEHKAGWEVFLLLKGSFGVVRSFSLVWSVRGVVRVRQSDCSGGWPAVRNHGIWLAGA